MAREGVTYEQVAAAADGMLAEGDKPTLRSLRERLRGGSPNTIHRHFVRWRELRPRAAAPAPELPTAVSRGIQAAIEQAAAEARAESEADLVQAQSSAAELAATGEELERECEALRDAVTTLTRERDTLEGRAAEQSADLLRATAEFERERARLHEELERERTAAEKTRIELAQERLTTAAVREQLAAQGPEIERLRTANEREHEGRIEAQRQQAALTSARDAALERVRELSDRETSAQASSAELRRRLDGLIDEARTTGAEVARLTEAAKRLGEDSERARAELAQREAAINHANKEHRERVRALEEELRTARAVLDQTQLTAKDDAVVRARLEAHEEARAKRESRTKSTDK